MLIPEAEFNNQKLFDVYQAAFMEPTMSDDGEVELFMEGAHVRGDVDQERSLFTISGIWRIKSDATRLQVLELCNRVNDRLIMIRCSWPSVFPEPVLFIDFTIDTKGGISGAEIVDATRRFVRLSRSVGTVDDDDILS